MVAGETGLQHLVAAVYHAEEGYSRRVVPVITLYLQREGMTVCYLMGVANVVLLNNKINIVIHTHALVSTFVCFQTHFSFGKCDSIITNSTPAVFPNRSRFPAYTSLITNRESRFIEFPAQTNFIGEI